MALVAHGLPEQERVTRFQANFSRLTEYGKGRVDNLTSRLVELDRAVGAGVVIEKSVRLREGVGV